MLRLRLQAPFAAFRPFTAGWYRPTAGFLTPSAAYGLALNLAGIETRRDDGLSAMTVTRYDLPPARIALGADPSRPLPVVQSVFQQLHNYPVGSSGKERKGEARGNKYNITPVRREFLSGLRAVVTLEFPDHPEIEREIRSRLANGDPKPSSRYGLPFLGDNAFLVDKIEVVDTPSAARWFRKVGEAGRDDGPVPGSTRLTTWVDRRDMSGTRTELCAPDDDAIAEVPDDAWTSIVPPTSPVPPTRTPKKK